MKYYGFILLFVGAAVGMYAFSIDTTVFSSASLDRINNLGLMSDKQNTLFVAGVLLIVGAVFIAGGYIVESIQTGIKKSMEQKRLTEKVDQAS
jgi:hypothetical protein